MFERITPSIICVKSVPQNQRRLAASNSVEFAPLDPH